MDATRIDPTIVEIEERADRDGIVDGFVAETGPMKSLDIGRLDGHGVAVHLVDETKQRLFGRGKQRCFEICENACNQLRTAQQFRRDRSVRFRSKRTSVQVRRVRRDQFADAG